MYFSKIMEAHRQIYRQNTHTHEINENRHADQWNRLEDLEINPPKYRYLIFDKGIKTMYYRKDRLFNNW